MAITALANGLAGMRSAQQALDLSAGRIAAASLPDLAAGQDVDPAAGPSSIVSLSGAVELPDLAGDMVGQIKARADFQLSAKVVQAADDLLGTLVDLRA